VWRAKQQGLFGRGQSLVVEATRAIRKGEELSMDYGPGKLDSGLLLDYGVLDTTWPQVRRAVRPLGPLQELSIKLFMCSGAPQA
jgi:hypothetical protein